MNGKQINEEPSQDAVDHCDQLRVKAIYYILEKVNIQATLQVVDFRKRKTANRQMPIHYRLVLSDGFWSYSGFFMRADVLKENLTKYSLLKVTDFTLNVNANGLKAVTILEAKLLIQGSEVGKLIGKPAPPVFDRAPPLIEDAVGELSIPAQEPEKIELKSFICQKGKTHIYKACKRCEKKVALENGSYKCSACGEQSENFVYRLILAFSFGDLLKQVWVQTKHEASMRILGLNEEKMAELCQLYEQGDRDFELRILARVTHFNKLHSRTSKAKGVPIKCVTYSNHLLRNL